MNELSSLLKRSFEGMGFCQGDYEDAAAAVVWLEAHGMNGLESIASTLSRRTTDTGIGVELVADEPGAQVLDANDSNIAFCGRIAVDLACADAATKGSGRIEIRRCHGRRAILPSLNMCAARGLHAIAYWYDRDSLHTASITSQQPAPSYRRSRQRQDNDSRFAALFVVCSSSRQTIDAVAEELAGNSTANMESTEVSSADIRERYDTAVRDGLKVDSALFRTLTAAADAVLVEATERSRLGAGESRS
ncbi:MAG: DUF3726 domain-containing protein [Woeseiaceae bacterium]